jgi:hypothetical protein
MWGWCRGLCGAVAYIEAGIKTNLEAGLDLVQRLVC